MSDRTPVFLIHTECNRSCRWRMGYGTAWGEGDTPTAAYAEFRRASNSATLPESYRPPAGGQMDVHEVFVGGGVNGWEAGWHRQWYGYGRTRDQAVASLHCLCDLLGVYCPRLGYDLFLAVKAWVN